MVKHTQIIRRQIALSVFDHFLESAVKGLKEQVFSVYNSLRK